MSFDPMPEEPKNEQALRDYVKQFGDNMPMRTKVMTSDGPRWKSVPFSELPVEVQERHIKRWLEDGKMPHAVIKFP